MVSLGRFWEDPHANMYSKYIIFRAIPCNLLLWGYEIWLLRQSLLDTLEVFIHHNIRRILGINMTKMRDMRIKNTSIRIMFYNIFCIRNQIALRKLSYVDKIFWSEGSHIPNRLLMAWCNHPRKHGRSLLTNNMPLARNLRLIILDVDKTGLLSSWGYHTLDTGHWRDMLATLKHPENTTPDGPTHTHHILMRMCPPNRTINPPPSPSPSPNTATLDPSETSSTSYVKKSPDTRQAGRK